MNRNVQVILAGVVFVGVLAGVAFFLSQGEDAPAPVESSSPVEESAAESTGSRENLDWLDDAREERPDGPPTDSSLPPGIQPSDLKVSSAPPTPAPSRSQRPDPPFRDAPPQSRSYEVIRAVDAEEARLGPMLGEQSREWLASDDDLSRAAGAIGLARAGELTEEDIAQVAGDSELSVPFLTLEALEAGGDSEEAALLRSQIEARGIGADDLIAAQAEQAFSYGGGEAVIDYAREEFSPEEVEQLADAFSTDTTLPYEARMKAAWEKRKAVPVAEYREYLAELESSEEAAASEEWNRAIERLDERWTGPDPVLDKAPVLDELTVHQAFGQEYERMLTDFRFELDYVLSHEEGKVGAGTADVLQEYLTEFNERPWSEAENVARERLAAQLEEIRGQETDASSIDSPPPVQ